MDWTKFVDKRNRSTKLDPQVGDEVNQYTSTEGEFAVSRDESKFQRFFCWVRRENNRRILVSGFFIYNIQSLFIV